MRDLVVPTAQRSCRPYLLSSGDRRDTSGGLWGGDCTDLDIRLRMDFRERGLHVRFPDRLP